MKTIATAVVTLASGSAVISCSEENIKGAEPDVPVDTPHMDVAGDMADMPWDVPDVEEVAPEADVADGDAPGADVADEEED
jgi:hypothetical protein